jgi:stress response protein YsnF
MNVGDKSAPKSDGHPESLQEPVSIAATQEDVLIGVEKQETGAVRVHKVVHEESLDIPVTLRSEHVQVQRVSINRPVESEYGPRQEGETLVIPVFEYVPVIEMRLMLKEEIHLTKQVSEQDAVQSVSVKKEEVVVEKRDGALGDWIKQE